MPIYQDMRILHIEDCIEDAELVHALLKSEWPQCEIDLISGYPELNARLEAGNFDLVLSDYSLGCFTGLDALRAVRGKYPVTPFIFLSGTIGEDLAIEAVRAGAQDYVIKDRMKRLVTAIHRALRDSHDRAQRDLAEQHIREQADLLNKAHDAIIVTDLDGHITFWNEGAERISGWASAEVIGRTPEAVLGVGFHARIDEARRSLAETGEWRGDLLLHDRNQKALIIEVSMTLIKDNAGRPKARLSIGTDVTDKKSMEEQFLRIQRIESIGMLASGIAHDLNNILAPILLAAPMLRDEISNPIHVRMMTSIEASAKRGTDLVRQILAFAHGASGAQERVQITRILQDTKNVITETFPKNIHISDGIPGNLWPITANPTQIHQVLLNLCVNARDAMPSGGRLSLRAENCVLDAATAQSMDGAKPGAWVVIHVEDTGSGIPDEALAHIWDPFFTTKGPGKGTGLGLSTVRGIVNNHKGFISLRTLRGQGTAFRVFFPRRLDPEG
jgi:two-component system, cell cycle sensor histidine kinase and response regulator CckA